jgi:hypothetical protein
MHLMPLHPLESDPDIGLDVFHDVADVEGTVGIRQCGGNENSAFHHAPEFGLMRLNSGSDRPILISQGRDGEDSARHYARFTLMSCGICPSL